VTDKIARAALDQSDQRLRRALDKLSREPHRIMPVGNGIIATETQLELSAPTSSDRGGVTMAPAVANANADVFSLRDRFNELLAGLRASGVIDT